MQIGVADWRGWTGRHTREGASASGTGNRANTAQYVRFALYWRCDGGCDHDARGRLASIIDTARHEPVYLTRRNRPVAAIIDTDQLSRLLEDTDELADIRAVDVAWQETERLGEIPIPWEDVKRDLGLS